MERVRPSSLWAGSSEARISIQPEAHALLACRRLQGVGLDHLLADRAAVQLPTCDSVQVPVPRRCARLEAASCRRYRREWVGQCPARSQRGASDGTTTRARRRELHVQRECSRCSIGTTAKRGECRVRFSGLPLNRQDQRSQRHHRGGDRRQDRQRRIGSLRSATRERACRRTQCRSRSSRTTARRGQAHTHDRDEPLARPDMAHEAMGSHTCPLPGRFDLRPPACALLGRGRPADVAHPASAVEPVDERSR